MAALKLYLVDAAAPGSSHGTAQVGGTAPGVATMGTGANWTTTSASNEFGQLAYNSVIAPAAFSTTSGPAAGVGPGTSDCFRTDITLSGTFLAAQWVLQFAAINTVVGTSGSWEIRVRVWAATSADGQTGARELTTAVLNTTNFDFTTTTEVHHLVNWTPASAIILNNEYLFFKIYYEALSGHVTASGTTSKLVQDGANALITTSDFVPFPIDNESYPAFLRGRVAQGHLHDAGIPPNPPAAQVVPVFPWFSYSDRLPVRPPQRHLDTEVLPPNIPIIPISAYSWYPESFARPAWARVDVFQPPMVPEQHGPMVVTVYADYLNRAPRAVPDAWLVPAAPERTIPSAYVSYPDRFPLPTAAQHMPVAALPMAPEQKLPGSFLSYPERFPLPVPAKHVAYETQPFAPEQTQASAYADYPGRFPMPAGAAPQPIGAGPTLPPAVNVAPISAYGSYPERFPFRVSAIPMDVESLPLQPERPLPGAYGWYPERFPLPVAAQPMPMAAQPLAPESPLPEVSSSYPEAFRHPPVIEGQVAFPAQQPAPVPTFFPIALPDFLRPGPPPFEAIPGLAAVPILPIQILAYVDTLKQPAAFVHMHLAATEFPPVVPPPPVILGSSWWSGGQGYATLEIPKPFKPRRKRWLTRKERAEAEEQERLLALTTPPAKPKTVRQAPRADAPAIRLTEGAAAAALGSFAEGAGSTLRSASGVDACSTSATAFAAVQRSGAADASAEASARVDGARQVAAGFGVAVLDASSAPAAAIVSRDGRPDAGSVRSSTLVFGEVLRAAPIQQPTLDAKPRIVVRGDPVHPVTEAGVVVGYQWGTHGTVYRSKAKAQEQAKAIFSAGYRSDSGVRAARRSVAKALAANKAAELQYTKGVVGALKGVHRGIMGMVEQHLLPAPEVRHDAREAVKRANDLLNERLNARIAKHLRAQVGPMYDLMAKRVSDKHGAAMAVIGIPVRDAAAGVAAKIAVAREDNIRLIEDAGRSYADDVRDVLTDPANEGLRVDELRDLLIKQGVDNVGRATLIAIDQTLKLSAALNQARQTAAGVAKFRWSTSRDERVRPSHEALEGEVFDWDDYATSADGVENEAGIDGGPDFPGNPIRCRCVPIPIIPDLEESSDEAAAE